MKDNDDDTQRMIHDEYDDNPRGCFLLVLSFLLACTSLIIAML